nr:crosslink repair DNA glycosylase YcaQ family protein [Ktedonobacter robiniae]
MVPISDWPLRATIREMYRPYHDREILDLDPETPERILAAMDANGPLSSLEFEDRSRMSDANSWYGLTKAKRALRSMWVCGLILTHHRRNGRHYYDRPERVIPDMHFQTPALLDREAYHRWIIGRRFQAVGLLRPNAEPAIWSACGDAATRKAAIAHLVAGGLLTHVKVGEKEWSYYLPTSALPLLENAASEVPAEEMRFLAPSIACSGTARACYNSSTSTISGRSISPHHNVAGATMPSPSSTVTASWRVSTRAWRKAPGRLPTGGGSKTSLRMLPSWQPWPEPHHASSTTYTPRRSLSTRSLTVQPARPCWLVPEPRS